MVSAPGSEFMYYCLDKYDLRKKKVLNVGCGGKKDAYFFENIINIDLLDYSEITNFIKCDAEEMPFEDESFDVVILIDMLEHTKHPFKVLEEISRVLKKEGYLITVNTTRFKMHGDEIKGFEYPDYWRFNEAGIRLLLEENEIKVIEEIIWEDGDVRKVHTLGKKEGYKFTVFA